MSTTRKNIWRLNKDPAIKAILLMLQYATGPNSFLLPDEQSLSDQAVRLVAPGNQNELSAYIYTYAQRAGRYGLDLEFPYLIETAADDQTIRLNDLTAEEVIENVIAHLEIPFTPSTAPTG